MDYLRGPEVITSPPERAAGGVRVGREGNMMTESEIETMSFEHGWRGPQAKENRGAIRAEKDKETRCLQRPHNEPTLTLQKPLSSN